MESPNFPSKPIHLALLALVLLPVLFGLQLWWLDCAQFQVLAGDDVRCFPTALQGLGSYNSLLSSFFRFRPVTSLLIWLSAICSQGHYPTLLMIGTGLHTLNAFIFLALLRKVTGVSLGLALGLTLIATFNRFTAYLITPELAIMEGAAITCYLLFLWALLRLIDTCQARWALLVGLSFFIVLHIHERYMVLAGACFIVAALIYRSNRLASFITCSCSLASLAFNFAAKKLLMHAPILMGTTTQAIEFNPKTILCFFADGMSNLGGVNRGPSYLSVLDYAEAPPWLKLFSVGSATLSLLILSCAIFYSCCSIKASPREARPGWTVVVLLCLVFALVLSASITFRQEYRWLYPAYLTFLILLGFGTDDFEQTIKHPIARIPLVGFIILAIISEFGIREHRANYYARSAYHLAENLYALIQKTPALKTSREIVIGGDELSISNWVFMGGAFASFYKLPPLAFSPSAPGKATEPVRLPSVVYHQSNGTFSLSEPADKNQVSSLGTAMTVNFPTYQLSTPNGKPSFAFRQFETQGWMLTSPVGLVVHAPGSVKNLAITFTHSSANGDGLDLAITAQFLNQQSFELLSVRVPALKNEGRPEWQSYQIKLPEDCNSIRLSLESRSGDQTSDWLFIRDFSFN